MAACRTIWQEAHVSRGGPPVCIEPNSPINSSRRKRRQAAMPSIMEEIQKDTLDHNVPVSVLLRKVKLAAAKLGLPTVEGWVDKELKGYSGGDEVPDYRKVTGTPVARGVIGGFEP